MPWQKVHHELSPVYVKRQGQEMSKRIKLILGLSLVVVGLGIGVYSFSQTDALGGNVIEQKVRADFDTVFNTVLAVLKDNREPVALADRSRGLINTGSVNVDNQRLRQIVAKEVPQFLGQQDGRYLLTFRLERLDESTNVTVTPLILVKTGLTANILGGQPVASNGTLEAEHLDAISKKIAGGN